MILKMILMGERKEPVQHPHHTGTSTVLPPNPPRHSTATARPQKKEGVTQKVTPPGAKTRPRARGGNSFSGVKLFQWCETFLGGEGGILLGCRSMIMGRMENDYTGSGVVLCHCYVWHCSLSYLKKVCVGGCSGPGCRRGGSMAVPWLGGGFF